MEQNSSLIIVENDNRSLQIHFAEHTEQNLISHCYKQLKEIINIIKDKESTDEFRIEKESQSYIEPQTEEEGKPDLMQIGVYQCPYERLKNTYRRLCIDKRSYKYKPLAEYLENNNIKEENGLNKIGRAHV